MHVIHSSQYLINMYKKKRNIFVPNNEPPNKSPKVT